MPINRLKTTSSSLSIIFAAAKIGSVLAEDIVSAFGKIFNCASFSKAKHIIPADVARAAHIFAEDERLRKQMATFFSSIDERISDVAIVKQPSLVSIGGRKELSVPYLLTISDHLRNELHARPMWGESRQLLALFVQLSRILPVINNGGFLVIDGIDDGICDEQLRILVELFVKQIHNTHGAQLIFTANSLDAINCVAANQTYFAKGWAA